MNYDPVPASSEMLQLYIAYLTTVKTFTYQSIRQYLNIVSHMHKASGFADPFQEDYQVSQELKGVKRLLGVAQTPVDVVTPQLLQSIHGSLSWACLSDFSFWCACLAAFFGLLRPGNITVVGPFNPTTDLRRVDLIPCSWGYILSLRKTKTIQFREKIVEVLLPRVTSDSNSVLCPVKACRALLEMSPMADPLGPLLLNDSNGALSYREFTNKLDSCLRTVGVTDSRIKGHSFRRGGASWLSKLGIPIDMIKTLGLWASDAVYRYVETDFEAKLKTMQKFANATVHM